MCSILKCLAVVDDLIKVKEEDAEHNGSKGESVAYYTFHGLKQVSSRVNPIDCTSLPPHDFQLNSRTIGSMLMLLRSWHLWPKLRGLSFITSLLMYSKSFVSMLFLGHLGDIALSGGSLSISFANITGYSVLKGLAMGMEPICYQAYGAKRWAIMTKTYRKTLILLLAAVFPISLLWLNMEPILLWLGQDENIAAVAKIYIKYSIPDLIAQAHFHPLRTFLRTQNINRPLTISVIGPSVLSVCLEWWCYEILLLLCSLLSNPQVGHELGADQPKQAQQTSIVGFTLAALWGILAFLFTTAVRDVWGRLFTCDPMTLGLTSSTLPLLGFCELGNSPQTAACGVLVGSARPKMGCNINFVSFYLIGLPVAALSAFKFNMGFVGLWFGMAAAQVSCTCMMVCTLICTDWKQQATRAKELTQENEDSKNDLEAPLLS
ncbi:UNVERIFIED_CONTAM: protein DETOXIFICATION 53 [Sesamum calycinum]|uniref:Protein DETOXIFICATION 53 n=1 Tax=Sesamum calycinum TaxID=2727403 RepID=A0AAW2RQ51_9LAMI